MNSVFEWDANKAQRNLYKHKVSFTEAATVFHDLFVATTLDPDHSDEEERFIAIGYSNKNRLLVVVFTERENKTRIITCRKADLLERAVYEEV